MVGYPARADKSAVIGINLRNYPSPPVGAREDDVGKGGPSRSPVGGACCPFISLTSRNRATLPSPAGDHKGLCWRMKGISAIPIDTREKRLREHTYCSSLLSPDNQRTANTINTVIRKGCPWRFAYMCLSPTESKRPSFPHPTPLAPTDHPAFCLSSWPNLTPMRGDGPSTQSSAEFSR